MAPRTLWTIILKILGFYILLQLLYTLPQICMSVVFTIQQESLSMVGAIAILLFTTGVFLFLLFGFFFRTDWLIDKLRLDKSFTEEKLELNIHRSTVLKITVIITGLLLFIETLPLLLKELFAYYQEINLNEGFKRYSNGGMIIFHLAEVLISFFMVTSSRLIVNFIERKRKGKVRVDSMED